MVVRRQKKHPLHLAFRAREGGEGVLTENPSVSQFERGRGWWWHGGVSTEEIPLRLAFRAREGWMGCVVKRNPPSVSRFERGRGGWGVSTKETPPPSRVSSEGGVGGVVACRQKKHPLRLAFRQKKPPLRLAFRAREGWGGVLTEETPLHLAFRAREGLVVVVACRQKKHPLRLAFRAREGCVDREPLRLAIRAREGTERVDAATRRRERLSLRRVGSVVSKLNYK